MSGASLRAATGARRPRRRPGENRAGLIIAGTIEFGLHGYAGAQTSAIAVRAGVSQPNVYANFASKRELFLACIGELPLVVEELAPGGQLEEQHALLLFQAVAAVREPALSPELGELLRELRSSLGAARFSDALSGAAAILLR
ncbi:TetR/AcrR family transcriptional regulator [Leucobacter aridicollis]|nr:TetR/AcrR family transcriptional regulator [Leucobacter aridicollis]